MKFILFLIKKIYFKKVKKTFFSKDFQACLTQLAEYRFCKPKVIGSTPIVGYLMKNFKCNFFNLFENLYLFNSIF
jgi:hypothetical protein